MSYQVGKPLSSVQTSSSLRQRAAKTIKKKKKRWLEKTWSNLPYTAGFKSMNTENQWGENHVPLRMNEVKTNWPQNCMFPFILSQIYCIFPVTLLCLLALTPQRREGERDLVPYSWEGQQKALGWLEKEWILYRPRGSESRSLQHFFPSIFMWAFHSFESPVTVYCMDQRLFQFRGDLPQ